MRRAPFSPAKRSGKCSITEERKRSDVVRETFRSEHEEVDQCSTRCREVVTACGGYKAFPFSCLNYCLTVDHLCSGKSSALQPPETHELGIIADLAYFLRHIACMICSTEAAVCDVTFRCHRGNPHHRRLFADDENHRALCSVTK